MIAMKSNQVLETLGVECEAMGRGLAQVADAQWDRATRCDPWSVRELLGHVCVVLGWVPGMLAAEAPVRAEISAAEYYRPDHRFDAASNAKRIALGRDRVGDVPVDSLPAQFAHGWRDVVARCGQERDDRVVRTRHGDAIALTDFLVTRIVEVAVHGLDLADALEREPWLTDPAADLVLRLLIGDEWERADALGWSRARFLRKATGREPLSAQESAQLDELGLRRLALG
jgi:uncharacterized protein (TIGR03083 family)